MKRASLLVGLLVGAGCLDQQPDLELSSIASMETVSASSGGCSTSVVIGLSKQIADEVSCMNPTGLVRFEPSTKLSITSNAVLPYLAKTAKADLVAASMTGSLQINSAFRTIAQQYLLVKWHSQGRCGITATAAVGNSNHESGRAIDVANYGSRVSILANHGWSHDVPGDDVHFDHLASADIRGLDTKAFQRLWNRNHPDDKLAEDGDYGPATAAKLAKSPAEGFAIGASCLGTRTVEVVSIDGPDRVPPAAQVHYTLRLKNTGTATWPATTKLVTDDGEVSALADASWTSPTIVGALDAATAPNATATVELEVTTPDVTEETPVQQIFALRDGSSMFGNIELAVTVAPDGEDTSMDNEPEADDGAGCSAGGGGGGGPVASLLVLGLLVARRRS